MLYENVRTTEFWFSEQLIPVGWYRTTRPFKKIPLWLNCWALRFRVGGIKYLFKYVCKGSDGVIIEFRSKWLSYDEVSSFQNARYVLPKQHGDFWAMNTLSGTHFFVLLDVRLKDQHMVYFQERQEKSAKNRQKCSMKLKNCLQLTRNTMVLRQKDFISIEVNFSFTCLKIGFIHSISFKDRRFQ